MICHSRRFCVPVIGTLKPQMRLCVYMRVSHLRHVNSADNVTMQVLF